MLNSPSVRPCWFCGSDENRNGAIICGFCNHHLADGPTERSEPEVGE